MRARSKSPKDKWQKFDFNKDKKLAMPLNLTTSHSKGESPTLLIKGSRDDSEPTKPNSKHIKRRSRSRQNRSTKNCFENEAATVADECIEPVKSPVNDVADQKLDTGLSVKPEIIVSDVNNKSQSSEKCILESSPSPILEYCTQIGKPSNDDSREITDRKLLTIDTTVMPLNNIANDFYKSRLSLSSISDTDHPGSCYDLNEQLKGIFGSVDKKHYRQRVFDRPRSKSDTRDLNELTQIFTHSPSTNDKYTCRFERSAGSVKNNYSDREFTPGRRSFDNILTPFGNTHTERSDFEIDKQHNESVRLSVDIFVFFLKC